MTGLRGRGRKVGIAAITAVFLVLFLGGDLMSAELRGRVRINEGDIYFGDPDHYKKPAVVDVDAVYARIPEYREILEKNLDSTSPRYLILLRAASGKFRKALGKCHRGRGYDLIGGLGSIEIKGKKVPNITPLVLKALPR
jgi:hypothetical protein